MAKTRWKLLIKQEVLWIFSLKTLKRKKEFDGELKEKAERGLIGTIGLNAWSPKHKRAEIGYKIHPNHWRKGYMSEALSKILSYASETLGLTRIGAVVFTENTASNNLLTKMGFQKEGILKRYMYQNGKVYDTYVYSFLPQK